MKNEDLHLKQQFQNYQDLINSKILDYTERFEIRTNLHTQDLKHLKERVDQLEKTKDKEPSTTTSPAPMPMMMPMMSQVSQEHVSLQNELLLLLAEITYANSLHKTDDLQQCLHDLKNKIIT